MIRRNPPGFQAIETEDWFFSFACSITLT